MLLFANKNRLDFLFNLANLIINYELIKNENSKEKRATTNKTQIQPID